MLPEHLELKSLLKTKNKVKSLKSLQDLTLMQIFTPSKCQQPMLHALKSQFSVYTETKR